MERNVIRSAQSNKTKAAGGLELPAYMQKSNATRTVASAPRAKSPKPTEQPRSGNTKPRRSPGKHARSAMTKLLRIAIAVLGVMLALVAAMLFIKPFGGRTNDFETASIDNGTFFEGIKINGIAVGSMTMEAARKAVNDAADKKLDEVNLVLQLGDKNWTLTREDLRISPDTDEVLKQAYKLGRSGSIIENGSIQASLKETGQAFTTGYKVDEEALKQRLEGIVQEAYQAPVEPKAIPDKDAEGKFTFEEGKNGVTVDEAALLSAAKAMIEAHDYAQPLQIPTQSEPPSYTLAQIKQNTKLISTYYTEFKTGSLKNKDRVANIKKASALLNGAVVQPGANFSFNEYIGPRTEKGGWSLAPGIVNGNTYEMQAGGGICQVSTTFYNALLIADLKIVDRKHHSWPSSYVPYGLDATVSTGGPDLVFQNNYDYPIYIFSRFEDKPAYKLTITIYGKPVHEDGVSVLLRNNIVEEKAPPEPIIIEDPLQPQGFSQVEITARTGYKVEVYKDYVKGDKVIRSVLLYKDTYRAIQGSKRVGTGAPEIPVQPVATPTPMP